MSDPAVHETPVPESQNNEVTTDVGAKNDELHVPSTATRNLRDRSLLRTTKPKNPEDDIHEPKKSKRKSSQPLHKSKRGKRSRYKYNPRSPVRVLSLSEVSSQVSDLRIY